MRIVFMGTAEFGIPTLQKLTDEGFYLSGVVSTPPRKKGRGLRQEPSAIEQYAKTAGVEQVITPANLCAPEFLSSLREMRADIFIVVAYRILPPEVFAMPRFGTINVHASLLPELRGAAPIQRAIEQGKKETGITVFQINRGIDTGNILVQEKTAIGDWETTPELYDRLGWLGAQACVRACRMVEAGQAPGLVQDERRATTAPKLEKEEARIDWSQPAQVLFNKIRAFKPFPGTYTLHNGKRLMIEWALPVESGQSLGHGTVVMLASAWFDVQCGENMLRILEVKPEGKKKMPAGDFLNGARITRGTKLG